MAGPTTHLWQAAMETHWAITEPALDQLLQIAARQHEPDALAAAMKLAQREQELDPQAITTNKGKRLQGTAATRLRGSIAILPVEGPLFRYGNLFTMMSGATSLTMLASDLQLALKDDQVEGILLHVDSPGGEVNGTGELADAIYKARGQKPIWAYVSHQGCSAAYWLASAADKILISPTSIMGNIGVVSAVPDPQKTNGKNVQFVSSQSPNKRPDPHTSQGNTELQRTVDTLAEQFIAAVARNRGVDQQTVIQDFGAGGVIVGPYAVAAGLADGLSDFETTLARMERGDPAVDPTPDPATTDDPGPTDPPIDATPPPAPSPRRASMGLREELESLLHRQPAQAGTDDPAPAPTPPTTPPTPVTTPSPAPAPGAPVAEGEPSELDRLRQRNAALQQQNEALAMARIRDQAQTFSESVVHAGHCMPFEQQNVVADYVQAALDDQVLPNGIRLPDGSTTSRVAQCQARWQARPKHSLTAEQIGASLFTVINQQQTPDAAADQPLPPAELERLIGQTPLGRTALGAVKPGDVVSGGGR